LEFERTRELIGRFLPPPPAEIVDAGGGSGPYAFWLAGLGYSVHLVDATARLVEEAARQNDASAPSLTSLAVGDARRLSLDDGSVDAVLLLGPLYHLPDRRDRIEALREARRVLKVNGVLIAAGISRYAGTLDGLALNPGLDPLIVNMRHRALLDGQYRNETDNPRYFVTAYFHRPEDLKHELAEIGYRDIRVFGVEGPGWLLPDFEARWNDPERREDLLKVARLLEQEASIAGASAHLLAVCTAG
jgi:ubiquinone/menaquinone biosynthesis C-methylase UbiE